MSCISCNSHTNSQCSHCFTAICSTCFIQHIGISLDPDVFYQSIQLERDSRKRQDVQSKLTRLTGPFMLKYFTFQGRDFFMFGENHMSQQMLQMLGGTRNYLDIEMDYGSNIVVPTGFDPTAMSITRFIYAAAGNLLQKQKQMDVFIETSFHRTKIERGAERVIEGMLLNMYRIFSPCFTGGTEQCLFHPFVQFHAIDYRGWGVGDTRPSLGVFLFEGIDYINSLTPKRVDDPGYWIELMWKDLKSLYDMENNQDWQKQMYLDTMTSNVYDRVIDSFRKRINKVRKESKLYQKYMDREMPYAIRGYVDKFNDLASRLEQEKMFKEIPGIGVVSRHRAQLIGLTTDMETSEYSDKLVEWGMYAATKSNIADLFDPQRPSNIQKEMLDLGSIYMDVPAAARMLRTFGGTRKESPVIFYSGQAHMEKIFQAFVRIGVTKQTFSGFPTGMESIDLNKLDLQVKAKLMSLLG